LLADQLRLLIGRRQPVRIWQDVAAIPHGADWLKAIHKALGESSFLIPIVTPAFLESEMCCQEVMTFREREKALGRDDLIFPFRYVGLTYFTRDECHDPSVFDLLNSRQGIDFAPLRLRPPDTEEVMTRLVGLAESIHAALRRTTTPVLPPVEPEPAPARQPELPRPAIIVPPPRPIPVP